VRYEYALPLWSERLGLSGKADCVEFHEDGTVYPVERKLGKKRRRRPDDLQLCAQALCLEDMLGLPVERGAIYSVKSRRRREVEFTPELRAETEAAILQVRELLRSGEVPPPAADKRCPDCSLIDVCQPDAIQSLKKGAIVGVLRALFEIEEVPP
jgi:CRISPR-associated exonuclease Cas4